jgi:hypothetical protein
MVFCTCRKDCDSFTLIPFIDYNTFLIIICDIIYILAHQQKMVMVNSVAIGGRY